MVKYLIVHKVIPREVQTYPGPKEGVPMKVVNEKEREFRCQDQKQKLIIVSKKHDYQIYNRTRILELLYF